MKDVEYENNNNELILSIKRNEENSRLFDYVAMLMSDPLHYKEKRFKKRVRGWIDIEVSNGEEIGNIIPRVFNEESINANVQKFEEIEQPVQQNPKQQPGMDISRIILTCSNPECRNSLKESQKIAWFKNNVKLFPNGLTTEIRKELNTEKYKHYCCRSCAAKMRPRSSRIRTKPTHTQLVQDENEKLTTIIEKQVEKVRKKEKNKDLERYEHLLRCSSKHCMNWLTSKQAKLWVQKNCIDLDAITPDELNSDKYKHFCCRSHAHEEQSIKFFQRSMRRSINNRMKRKHNY